MSAHTRQRALIGALALLFACGGKQVAPQAPATPIVLDAGSEPRHMLRRELRIGSSERIEQISRTMFNDAATTEPPSIRMLTRMDVAAHDKEDAHLRLRIEEAGVVEAADRHASLHAYLGNTSGVGGQARISPAGKLIEFAFEVPRPAQFRLAELSEPTRRSVIEFPAIPIGVGARWQIGSRVVEHGRIWNEIATYTLTGFDGDVATVAIHITGSAPSQPTNISHSDANMTGSMTGTGETSIPLRRIASRGWLKLQYTSNFASKRAAWTTRATTDATFQPR